MLNTFHLEVPAAPAGAEQPAEGSEAQADEEEAGLMSRQPAVLSNVIWANEQFWEAALAELISMERAKTAEMMGTPDVSAMSADERETHEVRT